MCIISNCIRTKKHPQRGLTGSFLTIVLAMTLEELFLLVINVLAFKATGHQHGANVKEGNQD